MASNLHYQHRDTMSKRAVIIYNPISGRPGRRAENARALIELLKERGVEAEAHATAAPNDAVRLAREATSEGAEIVVSYGGDGTLNEVLQGLVGGNAALAVWAGGTANVVARDILMPSDLKGLADVIAAGKTRRIALGRALSVVQTGAGERGPGAGDETGDSNRQPGYDMATDLNRPPAPDPRPPQRYFLMFAGIGLDASITRAVNPKLKRRTGEFAFWISGMKHIATWGAEPFMIEVDGRAYESAFAVIGNGKSYGGGLKLTPNADLEEALFEVAIFPPRSNILAYMPDFARCLRGDAARTSATIVKGRHIKVNSSDELWVEVDGELIGSLPMEFDIVPDALSIIIP